MRDNDDDSDTLLSDSTYFEENLDAESPEPSARTAGVFNPVARVLNFDEGNDTADEDR